MLRISLAIANMASKRASSKETIQSSTRESVEQISFDLPFYLDTQVFIKKGSTLTWQQIKDTFVENFKE